MIEIKPIETEYNGYRFRSRLEARWAVAFDAMGIKYEYEPEGFELPGGIKYLPDFKLTNVRFRGDRNGRVPLFAEIKGELSEYDKQKLEQFSMIYPIVLIGNVPSKGVDSITKENEEGWWSFRYIDGDEYPGLFCKYKQEIWFCGTDHDEFTGFNLIACGIEAAKRARFEHGEKPFDENWKTPFELMKIFGSENTIITDEGLEIHAKGIDATRRRTEETIIALLGRGYGNLDYFEPEMFQMSSARKAFEIMQERGNADQFIDYQIIQHVVKPEVVFQDALRNMKIYKLQGEIAQETDRLRSNNKEERITAVNEISKKTRELAELRRQGR